MLRFAPSPTEDMHIGNLRLALFNYMLSVQKNDGLIIRIEDTDKERNIEGKDQEIIGLLDLFGIKYTNVIYQSDNVKHHRTMALSLLHEKIAFNCFCTPITLDAKKEQAKADNKPYYYDEVCLSLSPEQTIDNESPFTVRLRKPNVNVDFTDAIKGKMSFSPTDIDSFIILRADKNPTYNYACAIDDMLADISMVIREDDHISNTPKQIAVRAALNYTKEIEYVHIPIILNDSGEKMNKDDDANSIKWLLEEGFLPEAIINYLILLGNKPPQEIFSLKEALEWFDLSKISKSPIRFDLDKLRFVNAQHLGLLDDIELSRYVGFADADIGKLAKLYLKEVSTTKELKSKIGAIFSDKKIPENFAQAAAIMKPLIQNAPYFKDFDEFKSYLMKESGLKGEFFINPLRLLLTGASHGPEIVDMYPYLKNYILEIVK
ncbi:glutamate--tRNA ligase [Sulfurimonas sp. MAG313]|nr:glutamate--tRNA ligase [Sulfurimonas sp. MAG313]MDF1881403.1 glutamate--tRNA ligase [Sulfurimonas sp. MAG313]